MCTRTYLIRPLFQLSWKLMFGKGEQWMHVYKKKCTCGYEEMCALELPQCAHNINFHSLARKECVHRS